VSGIAGIVRLDGAAAEEAAPRMESAIRHRGGDGSALWNERSVALIHSALHTTAESRRESQPIVSREGATVVVADLRLDNREELLRSLDGSTSDSGDAELLSLAYERWGVDCVRHIEGDFAFAIWDRRARTLFCARDATGVKPFVYCLLPGKLFAFASEVRGLLALPEVPRELDRKRIADFLSIHFADVESTFHRDLKRLPGGCTLLLRDGVATVSRYWDPVAIAEVRGRSDAQQAEGFLEHFSRATEARMRVGDSAELGAMLSGGLDSSAIACFARDRLNGARDLPVFSWVFSDAMEADERHYQEVIAATGGMKRYVIDSASAGYSPWSALDELLPNGPPYAPNTYINHAAAQIGRSLGVRTILDGLGGDGTISRGSARLMELFVERKFNTLISELRAISRIEGVSLTRLLRSHLLRPALPERVVDMARRFRARPEENGRDLLRPDLAALRAEEVPTQPVTSAHQDHVQQMQSPMLAEGLELFDRIMALSGAEGRYPFFDRRLIEYCIALPADQKLAEGYSRIVARRAFRFLPDEVRWRAGKGKPGLHIIRSLQQNRSRLDELFLKNPGALEPCVDLPLLRQMYDRLLASRLDFVGVVQVWSAAALGYWLRQLDRPGQQNLVAP
jgi:asparagine synthase (glutamine-hydrolysing)